MSALPVAHRDPSLAFLDEAIEKHGGEPLARVLAPRGLGPYRGYAEVLAALRGLAARGARVVPVGRSVRGEPLLSVQLGNPNPGTGARTSVVLAGLHPIEWIGIESALALLGMLAGRDLGDRAIFAVPIANPDGMLHVERNLRLRRRRFVRHNARGVDLNRNFDCRWGRRNLPARLIPWVFRPGNYPASEPEVSAIANALGMRRVDRALSLHSFGGAVLYPAAHRLVPPADAPEHRRWALRIAAGADERAYRVISSAWFGLGFAMGGLELDWFHQRHGALSLLVECSRGGLSWSPSSRWLEPFAWFNPPNPDAIANRIASASVPFLLNHPTTTLPAEAPAPGA